MKSYIKPSPLPFNLGKDGFKFTSFFHIAGHEDSGLNFLCKRLNVWLGFFIEISHHPWDRKHWLRGGAARRRLQDERDRHPPFPAASPKFRQGRWAATPS